jgi:hypothetical protein
MSFSFISSPRGGTLTDSDLVTSALDQPMSLGSTFWDQAKGGALESFGLGTGIRNFSTPEAAPPDPEGPISETLQAINRAIDPSVLLRRALGTSYDGSTVLTEDQYRRSQSYRADVPWTPGMTDERAASLAEQDDVKKVREFYGQKRPVTAFFGNLGGQAIDPINYVPIFGEAVQTANVARFGRVAGRALTAAGDAAANTAIAGLATAGVRGELGDDVSWQSTVSQIAMAALIGGAFGAIHGRFGRATPAELRADAEAKLATLDNVQASRVALNDALDGMIREGEVNLAPASTDFAARAADQELPKVVISRMAREADPEAHARLETLNRTFDINEAEIRKLQSQTLDNEQYGPTRGAMIKADEIAERLQKTQDAIENAPTEKEKALATSRAEDIKQELRDHLATIDDAKVREIESIDEQLAQRRSVQEPVAAERAQLKQRVDQLFGAARDEYWQTRFSQPPAEKAVEANGMPGASTQPVQQVGASVKRPGAAIDSRVPQAPIDLSVTQAAKRVGKPEGSKALAEQYRVNPETGDFPEMADIDQLRAEGRLTEDDIAALDDADETIKTANAYGEALKSFASCVI